MVDNSSIPLQDLEVNSRLSEIPSQTTFEEFSSSNSEDPESEETGHSDARAMFKSRV